MWFARQAYIYESGTNSRTSEQVVLRGFRHATNQRLKTDRTAFVYVGLGWSFNSPGTQMRRARIIELHSSSARILSHIWNGLVTSK
jgi:hypothetical protein